MQITNSWEEKGIVKGKLEIALRLLKRKLGNLSEETENHIKSLESNQLDILSEDLLDMISFEDLQNWLNNYLKSQKSQKDSIMEFAGSWLDVSDDDFNNFCEEIEQRRQVSVERRFEI